MPIKQHGNLAFGTAQPQFVGAPIDDIKDTNRIMYEKALANKQVMAELENYATRIETDSDNAIHKENALNKLRVTFDDISSAGSYMYAEDNLYIAANEFANDKLLNASVQQEAAHKASTAESVKNGASQSMINAFERNAQLGRKTLEIDEATGLVKNRYSYKVLTKEPELNKQAMDIVSKAKTSKTPINFGTNANPKYIGFQDGQWTIDGSITATNDQRVYESVKQMLLNSPENQDYFNNVRELDYYNRLAIDPRTNKYYEDEDGSYVDGTAMVNPDGSVEVLKHDYKARLKGLGIDDKQVQVLLDSINGKSKAIDGVPTATDDPKVRIDDINRDYGALKTIYENSYVDALVGTIAMGATNIVSKRDVDINTGVNQWALAEYKEQLKAQYGKMQAITDGWDMGQNFDITYSNQPLNMDEYSTATTNATTNYDKYLNEVMTQVNAVYPGTFNTKTDKLEVELHKDGNKYYRVRGNTRYNINPDNFSSLSTSTLNKFIGAAENKQQFDETHKYLVDLFIKNTPDSDINNLVTDEYNKLFSNAENFDLFDYETVLDKGVYISQLNTAGTKHKYNVTIKGNVYEVKTNGRKLDNVTLKTVGNVQDLKNNLKNRYNNRPEEFNKVVKSNEGSWYNNEGADEVGSYLEARANSMATKIRGYVEPDYTIYNKLVTGATNTLSNNGDIKLKDGKIVDLHKNVLKDETGLDNEELRQRLIQVLNTTGAQASKDGKGRQGVTLYTIMDTKGERKLVVSGVNSKEDGTGKIIPPVLIDVPPGYTPSYESQNMNDVLQFMTTIKRNVGQKVPVPYFNDPKLFTYYQFDRTSTINPITIYNKNEEVLFKTDFENLIHDLNNMYKNAMPKQSQYTDTTATN